MEKYKVQMVHKYTGAVEEDYGNGENYDYIVVEVEQEEEK